MASHMLVLEDELHVYIKTSPTVCWVYMPLLHTTILATLLTR